MTTEAATPGANAGALATGTFLVLGAGGLGCPALLGLAAAGARRLVVVDDDAVERSNLQRQVLFATCDLGVPKAEAAARRLRAAAPQALEVLPVRRRIDPGAPDDPGQLDALLDEVAEFAAPHGLVVLECTDSPALKFAANDACVRRGVPLVIGGVVGWEGQVMPVAGASTCYRCLYEAPPPRELAPACSEVGVMGAAAGHLGWLMAAHAVRLMSGDLAAAGTLTTFDGRSLAPRTLAPRPRAGCPACARRSDRDPNAITLDEASVSAPLTASGTSGP